MLVTGDSLFCLLGETTDNQYWKLDVAVWKGEGQKTALLFPKKPGQSLKDVKAKMRELILFYLNNPDKSSVPFDKRITEETDREMTDILWAFWPGDASSKTGNYHMWMEKQGDLWVEIPKPDNWVSLWERKEVEQRIARDAQRAADRAKEPVKEKVTEKPVPTVTVEPQEEKPKKASTSTKKAKAKEEQPTTEVAGDHLVPSQSEETEDMYVPDYDPDQISIFDTDDNGLGGLL
ncbi:hypothetical protein [Niallia taxi]|uniref:hypothetical protein n=1 Tax=Niallia taxi TaxID=2499688 RepID=UPI0015F35CC2|nr:hypothetical protein [Niallia taxi]